ncbi:MAG: hypothetical protein ACRDIB_07545, partial [Ardenticatenaceae bacterium]
MEWSPRRRQATQRDYEEWRQALSPEQATVGAVGRPLPVAASATWRAFAKLPVLAGPTCAGMRAAHEGCERHYAPHRK